MKKLNEVVEIDKGKIHIIVELPSIVVVVIGALCKE
jgi:hypothetical protein